MSITSVGASWIWTSLGAAGVSEFGAGDSTPVVMSLPTAGDGVGPMVVMSPAYAERDTTKTNSAAAQRTRNFFMSFLRK